MAIEYYKGFDTYVIYAADTAWGTAGTPSASNIISKCQSVTVNMNNNFIRSQGLGDGRNATAAVLGSFDISGSMEGDLDDCTWMQYAIGKIQGSGTLAAPYELVELNNIGYDATNIASITLELGSEGDSNDDVLQIDGVVFNSLSINGSQGEKISWSCDWIGRKPTSSTTLEVYTAASSKPFVFQSGTVTIGTDAFKCTSFGWTVNNNIQTWRDMGSRFISQPVTGLRRYDFSVTFKMKYDSTASILSGTELRDFFYGASNTPETGNVVTAKTLNISIDEGAAATDRVLDINLENCYFESWSQPIPLEGGAIEVTVNGFGLAGLTDGSDHVPIRWYTIS